MLDSIIWSKKKCYFVSTSKAHTDEEEGLRILINLTNNGIIPLNPTLKVIKPTSSLKQIIHSISFSSSNHLNDYSFLKSCHLCHKPLTLDKEVYMYRGDLGFCSVVCRDREIYMDEMKEIEISTKKVLASLQQRRCGGGRCETSKLLKELRPRHHTLSPQNNRVFFLHS